MTKQTLRAEVIARVKNLSPTYCKEADEAICRWVIQSDVYDKAQNIFCYVGTEREIDTMRLIHIMMRDGKNIAVPLCVRKGVMEARQIASSASWQYVGERFFTRAITSARRVCLVIAHRSLDLE